MTNITSEKLLELYLTNLRNDPKLHSREEYSYLLQIIDLVKEIALNLGLEYLSYTANIPEGYEPYQYVGVPLLNDDYLQLDFYLPGSLDNDDDYQVPVEILWQPSLLENAKAEYERSQGKKDDQLSEEKVRQKDLQELKRLLNKYVSNDPEKQRKLLNDFDALD